MAVFRLNNEIVFPNPELSEEDGLLAIGGDLSVERLILAFKSLSILDPQSGHMNVRSFNLRCLLIAPQQLHIFDDG